MSYGKHLRLILGGIGGGVEDELRGVGNSPAAVPPPPPPLSLCSSNPDRDRFHSPSCCLAAVIAETPIGAAAGRNENAMGPGDTAVVAVVLLMLLLLIVVVVLARQGTEEAVDTGAVA